MRYSEPLVRWSFDLFRSFIHPVSLDHLLGIQSYTPKQINFTRFLHNFLGRLTSRFAARRAKREESSQNHPKTKKKIKSIYPMKVHEKLSADIEISRRIDWEPPPEPKMRQKAILSKIGEEAKCEESSHPARRPRF